MTDHLIPPQRLIARPSSSDGRIRIGAPTEFALTAACAIWPPSDRRNRAIRAAAQNVADWGRFLRVVRRHRLEGLAHHGLSAANIDVPQPVKQALETRAAVITRRNLVMAIESARIQKLFDEAGVENLVLKGATLSVLAYHNPSVKFAWDIDLITRPETVEQAMRLLKQAGYSLYSPSEDLTEAQLKTYIALGRECIFSSKDRGIHIELKWCFDQNDHLLKGVSVRSSPQNVTLSERTTLRTLNKDDLFSYLCVHGARHGFSRLKWLADIAALLSADPPEEIDRLYRAAKARGAGRCAGQALLLCESLLALPLPAPLGAELRADWRTRWLTSIALVTMAGGNGEAELAKRRFSIVRILFSHFLVGRDLNAIRAELKLKWVSARDQMNTPLPRWAGFLYPFIRLPLSVWRRVR